MAGSGSPPRHAPLLRRQTSNLPGQVHHMAVMVSPNRIDYSVNKGGLRSWAVIIVFVLLCSAILNIFSEEGEGRFREEDIEKESLAAPEERIESFSDEEETYENNYNQKPKEESKGKADGAFGEIQEDEENDNNDEEEEEDEDEEDEEEEKKEEDDEEDETKINFKNEEELMLAKLSEKSIHSTKRKGKISAKIMEEKEKFEQQKQNEEKGETINQVEEDEEEEKEKEENDENAKNAKEILLKIKEHSEDRQIHRRRVKSWRALQTQKSLTEGMRPRKSLLKRKPKQHKYTNEMFQKPDDADELEEIKENNLENEQITELVAKHKLSGSYSTRKTALTSRSDFKHRNLLDEADFLLEQHDFVSALEKYQKVLVIDKYSPRAHFGRARAYQLMSEFASDGDSRKLLDKAMAEFEFILLQNYFEDIPDELYRISARHFVECARFRGANLHKILQIQRALVDRFPDDLDAQCDFGATWLGMNRPEEAANVFKNILNVNPSHALAQAYYGYILKVYQGDLERGVNLMRRALRSSNNKNVVKEQKFYFHLGDALTRLGRLKEAYSVYSDAVNYGLFPSVLQRSLHNLEHLTAHPWWTIEQIDCSKQLRQLERHWTTIKEEALNLWRNHQHLFHPDNYFGHLIEKEKNITGHWILIIKEKSDENLIREEICKKMPYTCQMLKEGGGSSGYINSICARENIRLSVLQSGVSTWPHCGQSNYVLEGNLGLYTHSDARVRVGNETRGWRQGKMLIYDTSFEQEIIFEGAPANALRIALILELWHPQVPHNLRGKIKEEKEERLK